MGLYVQKNDNRSELQQRLAAELQEKAKARAKREEEPVDTIEDSAYLRGTKRTTSLAWVWVLILIAAIVATVVIVMRVNG